ncbi:MAG: GlmU family protein [Cyclobacteriaceae bacterium]|nr:GlmU family protein [Cyclobacteriaceae bacterium]
MNLVLFDTPSSRSNLLPFTYTRPLAEMRVGILKIAEKWKKWLAADVSFLTEEYLSVKYPPKFTEDNIYIAGNVCPDEVLVQAIDDLKPNQKLIIGDKLIASRQGKIDVAQIGSGCEAIELEEKFTQIERPWHIFKENGAQIRLDYDLITQGRQSRKIEDPYTRVYGSHHIFIEEGVSIKDATLNAENGPIYIGKGAVVEEGSIIRGPFALCEHSTVNANARMRGDITIGPYSKVGGEVSNSVIFGCSNKGHDGFLGNSVLGEWCNIGADTNTSNLKNNYDMVKVWDYTKSGFVNTGEQFCGLMMGDHSKCGINTMFNTGTVVGVAANIFGSGFPRTFIPSFAWGGAGGFATFKLPKVFEMATITMSRRKKEFTDSERQILESVYTMSEQYRVWEK